MKEQDTGISGPAGRSREQNPLFTGIPERRTDFSDEKGVEADENENENGSVDDDDSALCRHRQGREENYV